MVIINMILKVQQITILVQLQIKNNSSYPIITVLQSAMLASKVNAPSVYDINNVSNNFKNRIKVNLEK